MPEKVLLATDGSKDAALAARTAVDVCQGTDAELHVVHAWHSVPTARFRPFMRAELKKLGKELLEVHAYPRLPEVNAEGRESNPRIVDDELRRAEKALLERSRELESRLGSHPKTRLW